MFGSKPIACNLSPNTRQTESIPPLQPTSIRVNLSPPNASATNVANRVSFVNPSIRHDPSEKQGTSGRPSGSTAFRDFTLSDRRPQSAHSRQRRKAPRRADDRPDAGRDRSQQ